MTSRRAVHRRDSPPLQTAVTFQAALFSSRQTLPEKERRFAPLLRCVAQALLHAAPRCIQQRLGAGQVYLGHVLLLPILFQARQGFL
jgi:hypothetical protein